MEVVGLSYCVIKCFMLEFLQLLLHLFAVDDGPDIIDESLQYFKANVFFKSFEVKVTYVCALSLSRVCVCVCACVRVFAYHWPCAVLTFLCCCRVLVIVC